jgi:hypothetical protein
MTETDVRDVGGIVMVDKILENAERMIYVFDTIEQGSSRSVIRNGIM